MKVTIIGPGGFTGQHFCAFLQQKGVRVTGVSSSQGTGIDPLTGDLSNQFHIEKSTDAVVFLAQSPYYRQNQSNFYHIMNVNMMAALKVAEIARKSGVRKYIYASTGNVYSPSFAPLHESSSLRRDDFYSLSKIHAEETLSFFRDDFQLTVIRPFGIYGPGQKDKLIPHLLKSILEKKKVYIEKNPLDATDRNGLRVSFCFIDDLVEILAQLLYQDGPPVLNIAGEKGISIREVAASMASLIGKEVSFHLLDRNRQGDLVADITLLKKVISHRFTSFQQGLAKTVEFALQNLHLGKE